LAELQLPPYSLEQQVADCEYVAKKLQFSADEFRAMMDSPPKKFDDYPSYSRFMRGRTFRNMMKIWQLFKYGFLRKKRGA
jgi:hypothetical protein